jgi:hypothetical protein
MIAGEGLIGILLALFAIIPLANGKTLAEAMNLSAVLGISDTVMNIGSIALFAIIILTFCGFTVWKKNKKA